MNEKPNPWFGYVGQVLRIDLTHHKWTAEPLKKELVENFIGGRGLCGLWALPGERYHLGQSQNSLHATSCGR